MKHFLSETSLIGIEIDLKCNSLPKHIACNYLKNKPSEKVFNFIIRIGFSP